MSESKISLLTSSLFLLLLFMPLTGSDQPALAEEQQPAMAQLNELYKQIEQLVKEYYPKAKFSRTGTDIHFELKLKKEFVQYTGKAEKIPQEGGILGDLSVTAGEYKERIPAGEHHEGFHTTLVVSPYSNRLNAHLLAKLVYPQDTSAQFCTDFKDLVNQFVAGENPPPDTASAERGTETTEVAAAQPDQTAPKALRLPPSAVGLLPGLKPPEHTELTSEHPELAAEPPQKLYKSIVTEQVDLRTAQENKMVKELEKSPEKLVYDKANAALKTGKYDLARKLYESLCTRKPRDPRYFFGAGMAYRMKGDDVSAFSNLVIAWHLGDQDGPIYKDTAETIVAELKPLIDDQFRLTYKWNANDPETILNAGTRLWKAGFPNQAYQLFEYALHHEPLYARIAAYNLGAMAEHNGDLKTASLYYEWALKQSLRLEAEMNRNPAYRLAIRQTFDQLQTPYLQQAVWDVQSKLQSGSTSVYSWRGWQQATIRPQHWSSEVCPICAISRTKREVRPFQTTVE